MGEETTLTDVMEFRDRKAMLQRQIMLKYPKDNVISLGMNIPGPVKNNLYVNIAFKRGMEAVEKKIAQQGWKAALKVRMEQNAGFCAIYLVSDMDGLQLKKEMVLLEERHPMGRIFDLDVFTAGKAITREMVETKGRKCLLCGQDAKICGRNRTHSVKELQEKVWKIVREGEEALKDVQRVCG